MGKRKHQKHSDSESETDRIVMGKKDMSEEVFWECGPVKEETVPWVSEGVRELLLARRAVLKTDAGL